MPHLLPISCPQICSEFDEAHCLAAIIGYAVRWLALPAFEAVGRGRLRPGPLRTALLSYFPLLVSASLFETPSSGEKEGVWPLL